MLLETNHLALKSTFLFYIYFQRENIEMFLKGCEAYGLKAQDLFQVNDLFENKNLYMIVDNLFSLGGHVSLIKFCVVSSMRSYHSKC